MTVPDYATLAECKAAFPDNSLNSGTNYDAYTTSLITRCSRTLDRYTNREPGAYAVTTVTTRYFDGPGYGLFSPLYGVNPQRLTNVYNDNGFLSTGEMAAAPTEVAVSEMAQIATVGGSGTYTVWPTTDYYCEPYNAAQFGRPYLGLRLDQINGTHRVWYPFREGIRVKGYFGYSQTVPDDIKQAAILMVIRLLRKAQQNYVDVGTINDAGQVMQGSKVDTDIADMIRNYRRMAI